MGIWYGVFLVDGLEIEVMDVLEYVWIGEWLVNWVLYINIYIMNGVIVVSSVYMCFGSICIIDIDVYDFDKDQFIYKFEFLFESIDICLGGDVEVKFEVMDFKIICLVNGEMEFCVFIKKGLYWMFIYIYDGNNNVVIVNIFFFVSEDSQ